MEEKEKRTQESGKGVEKARRILDIFDCRSVAEYMESLKTTQQTQHKPQIHTSGNNGVLSLRLPRA